MSLWSELSVDNCIENALYRSSKTSERHWLQIQSHVVLIDMCICMRGGDLAVMLQSEMNTFSRSPNSPFLFFSKRNDVPESYHCEEEPGRITRIKPIRSWSSISLKHIRNIISRLLIIHLHMNYASCVIFCQVQKPGVGDGYTNIFFLAQMIYGCW